MILVFMLCGQINYGALKIDWPISRPHLLLLKMLVSLGFKQTHKAALNRFFFMADTISVTAVKCYSVVLYTLVHFAAICNFPLPCCLSADFHCLPGDDVIT